jgi:predicted secreted protein
VLRVHAEDPDPAALANRVNRAMSAALQRARGRDQISVQTGAYQTYPVHEKERLLTWRASQDLIVRGSDFSRVSELIGQLQDQLQLASMAFDVSPERRAQVTDELIAEALQAFRARANLIREQLGAQRYEIAQLSLGSPGEPRPVDLYAGRARVAAAEAVAPPALEAGVTRLEVSVHATIQLD